MIVVLLWLASLLGAALFFAAGYYRGRARAEVAAAPAPRPDDGQLAEARAQADALARQLAETTAAVEAAHAAEAAASAAAAAARAETATLATRLAASEAGLAAATQAQRATTDELASAHRELTQLRSPPPPAGAPAPTVSRAQHDQLQATLHARDQVLAVMRQQEQVLRQQERAARDALAAHRTSAAEQATALGAELDELRRRLEASEQGGALARRAYERLTEEITQARVEQRQAAAAAAEREAAAPSADDVAALRQDLAIAAQRSRDLTRDLDALRAERDRLNEALDAISDRPEPRVVEDLRHEHGVLRHRLEVREAEVGELRAARDRLAAQLSELGERPSPAALAAAQHELSMLREVQQARQLEAARLLEENLGLKRSLAEYEQLRTLAPQLREEVRALQARALTADRSSPPLALPADLTTLQPLLDQLARDERAAVAAIADDSGFLIAGHGVDAEPLGAVSAQIFGQLTRAAALLPVGALRRAALTDERGVILTVRSVSADQQQLLLSTLASSDPDDAMPKPSPA